MVLFLHNRYRSTGGEERTVTDLCRLVREQLGEDAQVLERQSAGLGRGRAAIGLLGGGVQPQEVARAVARTGARVLHAHNLNPTLGWRSLAAARDAGARVVLHLHNYRLVCAVGVCFTREEECTRCHARNTLPGVVHRCRSSTGEAAVYAAALALWQRRLVAQADAVIVPSAFARERLRALGAPLAWDRVHVIAAPVSERAEPADLASARYALVAARLVPEKGIDAAIDACREAGVSLVVAGDGPLRAALGDRAAGADVRFAGSLDAVALDELRRYAGVALVPSRVGETFGLAAAEAMAAGVPVVASRRGALPELVEEEGLIEPGDVAGMARALALRWGDAAAAQRGRESLRRVASPPVVAQALAAVYDG